MDLFRFHGSPLSNGEIIDNYKSIEWIERYLQPGTFKIEARATQNLQFDLPIGTFVSHTRSDELMCVEDHHISDDDDPIITITGRSFESFLENRIVGSNKTFPSVGEQTDLILDGDWYTWIQAVSLLARHTEASYLLDDNNALPYTEIQHNVTGTGTKEEQSVPRIGLHTAVIQLLEIDDLGIKTLRPGKFQGASSSSNCVILVHRGVDRSGSISLSYDSGDIETAEYFYSNQKEKNCCLVTGKWVEVLVDSTPPKTGFSRRMMTLDASDIDDRYTVAPTGATLDWVISRFQSRGKRALAAQKNIALSNVEATSTSQSKVYGIDYGIGDIVTVRGNYQETRKMRVTEYVEIEDEAGVTSYPTLSELEVP